MLAKIIERAAALKAKRAAPESKKRTTAKTGSKQKTTRSRK